MSIPSSIYWLKDVRWLAPERTAGAGLFLGIAGVCLFVGLVYHTVVWAVGSAPPLVWQGLYHVAVFIGFAALWLSARIIFQKRAVSPLAVFWTILIAGVAVAAVGWSIWTAGPSLAEQPRAGTLSLSAVALMHAIVLLEAVFFFFVLARLRQLVLFKRTRQSERNWQLMMGSMVLAALFAVGLSPDDGLGIIQAVFIVPAVILMVVNSFRLSWIIFLSFREKMITMGLALVVIIMLSARSGLRDGFLPDAAAYLTYYSYPLHVFLLLIAVFAILYAVTAWTSLLFHLPTTSDFQRKADELAAMHGMTHLVEQAFEREKLAQSIVSAPVEAGTARAAWLMLPNEDSEEPRSLVAARGISVDRLKTDLQLDELYQEVYRLRSPLELDQAPADPRVKAQPGTGIESLLAVPLLARKKLVGVLFAASDVSHGFEADDIEAISGFGAQAALALDHARLFEEQLEKERLERELDIAREVQQRLLPTALPAVPGASLHASSVPAQEVGGDYYDFLPLDDGRLAFIIADVSGKGTSAAFFMAELQGIFRSLSALAPDPEEFLRHANKALYSVVDASTFTSAVYGVLDPEAETLSIARAGHCPIAFITLHGEAHYLRPNGMGLGMDGGTFFDEALAAETLDLRPGDAFVLYTDGVVESRNGEGEEFGYDRLLDALRRHRHENAETLHQEILDELRAFTGTEVYSDDMTMVVIKWHALRTNDASVTTDDSGAPREKAARLSRPVTEKPPALG